MMNSPMSFNGLKLGTPWNTNIEITPEELAWL